MIKRPLVLCAFLFISGLDLRAGAAPPNVLMIADDDLANSLVPNTLQSTAP